MFKVFAFYNSRRTVMNFSDYAKAYSAFTAAQNDADIVAAALYTPKGLAASYFADAVQSLESTDQGQLATTEQASADVGAAPASAQTNAPTLKTSDGRPVVSAFGAKAVSDALAGIGSDIRDQAAS